MFPEGIRIIQDPAESTQATPEAKPIEPQDNAVEADLSNDVDEIRKQSKENLLSDESDNLIKDETPQ